MARYTEQQRADALAILKAEGGNLSRAEVLTGISVKTLRVWRDNLPPGSSHLPEDFLPKKEPVTPELVQEASDDLATRFEKEIGAILATLPGKRDGASYKDLATSVGILTDKIQLLRGQPTQRQEVLSVERKPPTPDTLRELQKRLDRAELN